MNTKRKVRADFDKTKEITVNVEKCSLEEKMKVQQAFFDAGVKWKDGGSYTCLNASFYTNTNFATGVVGYLLWGSLGIGITPDEFYSMVYEDL